MERGANGIILHAQVRRLFEAGAVAKLPTVSCWSGYAPAHVETAFEAPLGTPWPNGSGHVPTSTRRGRRGRRRVPGNFHRSWFEGRSDSAPGIARRLAFHSVSRKVAGRALTHRGPNPEPAGQPRNQWTHYFQPRR